MEQIKRMLLGNAIISISILIHLLGEAVLLTDLLAILGIILVFYGYSSKPSSDSQKIVYLFNFCGIIQIR